MRRHCCAVDCIIDLRVALAKSFDPGVCARRGGVCGRRGAWTRRLSVSSPVPANRGVPAEFPGSFGPVDRLRHRGPHRGGLVRENSGSAEQTKPSAWPQHRVDGGRDARGQKFCRRLGLVRGPARPGRSGDPSSPCSGIRSSSAATSPRRCVNLAKTCARRECCWLKRRQMNCRSKWLSRWP